MAVGSKGFDDGEETILDATLIAVLVFDENRDRENAPAEEGQRLALRNKNAALTLMPNPTGTYICDDF